MRQAIGVDVGGTKIEASLVLETGVVVRTKRVPTPLFYDETKRVLLDLIRDVRDDKEIAGVGFSIPGGLDPETKRLRNAPNSPGINETDFFDVVAKGLDVPVCIENDANCLVLSETLFGVAKDFKNVVGLILGSGVGSGVVLDRKLFVGSRGLAPEIGHVPLDVHGRDCLCGNKGCVEAYLSGNSILRRFQDGGGDKSIATTEEIFKRQSVDAVAGEILAETKQLYLRFLAMLVSLYDPDVFVLGGGLSLQNLFYNCEDQVSKFIFGKKKSPKILKAALGDASGKMGAAALVFDRH